MTQPTNEALKEFRILKRFTMIQFMLMIAVSGVFLTLIANYFQL